MKILYKLFDKLEDVVRSRLSHFPIFYGIVGGTLVVSFWRGIWHTADILETWGGWWGIVFSGPGTLIFSALGLLATGLMVSTFIGNNIIISGLKREKKVIDKTEKEIQEEGSDLERVKKDLMALRREVDEYKNKN